MQIPNYLHPPILCFQYRFSIIYILPKRDVNFMLLMQIFNCLYPAWGGINFMLSRKDVILMLLILIPYYLYPISGGCKFYAFNTDSQLNTPCLGRL